ncbi:DnaB-like helicase N-terminal domain-containing protein [Parabacteroides distasonis]|uniref:DnaB-like helicase N-terminal domain-containing protein n=1 Tax=Parabacteroides distasonis TaxID=823 RepID=UPI001651ACA1|nr:DnaB-like helicase N-terminal domain-containing protein [Parabacteroides distasonis]
MARTSIAQTSLTSSLIDGKLPPQAKEIEQIILGACLIESDAFEKIASELSESDFYDKRNQSVFKAISGLYKERKPIDMMTVTQAMLSSGELESIGGPIYIASLTSKIGSSAHILDHAMIVKERSIQRKGLAIANDLENAIYSNEDIGDVLHKAINGSETLMEELIGKSNGEHISKALKGSMDGLYKRVEMARKNIRSGVDTGLHDLNKITNGWQPGNLVIIAARPSMGKALRMDAKVLTPSGWKLNKDLAIGDQVCSVDGAESRVTGIFPQGHVKTYMVEFLGRSQDRMLWQPLVERNIFQVQRQGRKGRIYPRAYGLDKQGKIFRQNKHSSFLRDIRRKERFRDPPISHGSLARRWSLEQGG